MSGAPDDVKYIGESELFLGTVRALNVAGTSCTSRDPASRIEVTFELVCPLMKDD